MNEQELKRKDRKLAEWVGTKVDCWQCHGLGNSYWLGKCLTCNSTGKLPLSNLNVCPNFTQSLDACFKWLVPKTRKLKYYVILRDIATSFHCSLVFTTSDKRSWYGEAKTPALALCLAIEKLIDNEETK